MYSFDNLKSFLRFFDIAPGCHSVSQKELETIVAAAEMKYGKEFSAVVMDCFDPAGENVDQHSDDYKYYFDIPSWDQLKIEFES